MVVRSVTYVRKIHNAISVTKILRILEDNMGLPGWLLHLHAGGHVLFYPDRVALEVSDGDWRSAGESAWIAQDAAGNAFITWDTKQALGIPSTKGEST